MDGRPNHRNKVAFSNFTRYVPDCRRDLSRGLIPSFTAADICFKFRLCLYSLICLCGGFPLIEENN